MPTTLSFDLCGSRFPVIPGLVWLAYLKIFELSVKYNGIEFVTRPPMNLYWAHAMLGVSDVCTRFNSDAINESLAVVGLATA